MTFLYLKSVTFGFPFKNESSFPNTMFKKLLLSASLLAGFAGTVQAQTAVSPCGADEIDQRLRAAFPDQVAKSEAKLQRYIDAALHGVNLNQYAKVTVEGNDTVTTYHIPLVFHIIHEYGSENVKDNEIYNSVKEINDLYNKRNADTTQVLPIFRKIRGTNTNYIGKTKFVFHLAQTDPFGQPTNGITRRRHYVTLRGGDFGKLDGWARDSYVNIWVNKYITNAQAAAYATFPTSVDNPSGAFIDGIMSGYNATTGGGAGGRTINYDNTLTHELGHIFGLRHVWGATNDAGVDCGDDGIDDTPPTKGHQPQDCNTPDRYDSSCILNNAIIGKIVLDSARRLAATTVNDGVSFRVYTNVLLDTVSFYPSVAAGAPYTVQIRQNGTLISSKSDTTNVAAGQPQKVAIRTKLPAGTGFTLSFAVNPGAYKDTVGTLGYTTSVPGAIYFTSDTAIGGQYRYFNRWVMRYGYFKLYDTATYRSLYVFDTVNTGGFPGNAIYLPNSGFLVDYPDTSNSENVMDYTYCSKMFTHGQSTQMRIVASSPIAQRNNLSSLNNLVKTGIFDNNGNVLPKQDLKPVADFSLGRFPSTVEERLYVQTGVFNTGEIVYKCTGGAFNFTNQSNRDTISSVAWDFGPGASPATSTATGTVNVTFNNPGYATVSLKASSNAGDSTITRQPVYLADKANPINPNGYFLDFNPDQNLDRWPIFNYYNNDFKWEFRTDVGMYDKTSISYRNYDPRVPNGSNFPSALLLPGSSPSGDFDDFFSPPFNLNDYKTGNVNLNFNYASAARSSISPDIRDTLAIYASVDCGNTWKLVGIRSKGDLVNNSTVATPFTPGFPGQWASASMDMRSIIQAPNVDASAVLLRFRYRPGAS